MSGKDTGKVFTYKAVILSLLAAAAGFIAAVLFMLFLGIFKINNADVEFFLRNGHISFKISFATTFVQYILMVALTALAVRGTAKKAAKLSPAEALRSVK
jgi:putative ABC transport system permease protein